MKYWPAVLRWGTGALTALVTLCFIYGFFNRFEFWHAASPPGMDSAVAYAWFSAFLAGPYVFTLGAIVGAIRVWLRKLRKNNSDKSNLK